MNLTWITSFSLLAAAGIGIRRFGLEQVSQICAIIYCALGSMAALKYLLQRGRYSPKRKPAAKPRGQAWRAFRSALHEKRAAISPRPSPGESAPPCQPPADPVPDPIPAVPDIPPVVPVPVPAPTAVSEIPAPANDLPGYPAPSEIRGIYEVENPGYSRNQDYGLRLKKASDGALISCALDQELVCVFIRRTLAEVGANLQRQGLTEVFDLLDAAGQPLAAYPRGRLRLVTTTPAICRDLGTALQLIEKGQVKVLVKE